MHVVFGAGQVGAGLARRLAAQGLRVRVVRRGAGEVGPGIEVVSGDARDPAFVLRATEGATVLYHCMNPATYSGAAWEAELPALGEALIAAAVAHDARLVCLDNLYGTGVTEGVRTEQTPMAPVGRKSGVRAAWDARLRAEPQLRFVVGRAGDFFGPGTGEHSLLSRSNLGRLLTGGRVMLVGDADAPHAFSYVPDVVAGLAALGTATDVEREVFHLPIVQRSPRALVDALAQALGVAPRTLVIGGRWMWWLGVVWPLARELRETLYQWDRPFLASDARFRGRFPEVARSDAQVVAELAGWLGEAAA
jgi:nucleoside-diphosphate-sugar epimerase